MDPEARQQYQDLLASAPTADDRTVFPGMQAGHGEDADRARTDGRDSGDGARPQPDAARPPEGREPKFDEFMQKHGHYFPPDIENLDQLLEHLQQQMQRMENMMESMSPQQRAQLQGMMEVADAGRRLQARWPNWPTNLGCSCPWAALASTASRATPTKPLSMSEAMQVMEQLDQLEQLERELNAARRGDKPRRHRPRAAGRSAGCRRQQALDQLHELAKQLEDAGYLEWKGDEMQLTPRATRKIGQKALQDIFS